MKTWEMLKSLGENPKASFISKNEPRNPVSLVDNILCWKSGNRFEFNTKTDRERGTENAGTIEVYEWELVREPVDFMTAVKAYEMGKTIKCDTEAISTRIYKPGLNNILVDQFRAPITTDEIINGKWLIE